MTATDIEVEPLGHRQQQLYFRELFQLKVQCEYIRWYRGALSARVTWFSGLRAISSSGGIAGWVIWKEYAFVWAAIIALSQLADALRDVLPFTARQKAANALLVELDALFIETLYEWEAVFSGKLSNEEITERRRKLMRLKHELEAKHFPTGDLPDRAELFALAEQDAIDYLQGMFGGGDEA